MAFGIYENYIPDEYKDLDDEEYEVDADIMSIIDGLISITLLLKVYYIEYEKVKYKLKKATERYLELNNSDSSIRNDFYCHIRYINWSILARIIRILCKSISNIVEYLDDLIITKDYRYYKQMYGQSETYLTIYDMAILFDKDIENFKKKYWKIEEDYDNFMECGLLDEIYFDKIRLENDYYVCNEGIFPYDEYDSSISKISDYKHILDDYDYVDEYIDNKELINIIEQNIYNIKFAFESINVNLKE